MKGWELTKKLFSGVGIYRRKLSFFVVLVIFIVAVAYLWQTNKNIRAYVKAPLLTTDSANQATMDVIITENGQGIINGKKNREVIKFYDNYDELHIIVYDAPGYFIKNFQGTVHLPKEVSKDEVRLRIIGNHGVGTDESYMLDSETLIYKANDISPQGFLAIVAELPKGFITPSFGQRLQIAITKFPLKNWLYVAIFLPALTIIIMTFMILKRRSAQTFLIRYTLSDPPSKDSPAVVGALIDGTVGAREIAATLIDIARRGYIFIIDKGQGEFTFGKRRMGSGEDISGLSDFEKPLLGKIFLSPSFRSTLGDVEMRIGRHIFSRKVAQFYLGVYNRATRQGYFLKNPAKVHLSYKYLGVVMFFLSFVGFIWGAWSGADPKFGLIFWVGGMVAAFFIIKLSPFMPARTDLGNQELKKWLAFRRYLVSKQPLQAKEVLLGKFEEYLPYAVVLGCEVEWANRFGREPFVKPDWYESAARVVILEGFVSQFFPFLGFVAENLARSHEPTVE